MTFYHRNRNPRTVFVHICVHAVYMCLSVHAQRFVYLCVCVSMCVCVCTYRPGTRASCNPDKPRVLLPAPVDTQPGAVLPALALLCTGKMGGLWLMSPHRHRDRTQPEFSELSPRVCHLNKDSIKRIQFLCFCLAASEGRKWSDGPLWTLATRVTALRAQLALLSDFSEGFFSTCTVLSLRVCPRQFCSKPSLEQCRTRENLAHFSLCGQHSPLWGSTVPSGALKSPLGR